MPKYSIIVPVYNTSAYLPRCIDSIKAQTYTDFEVIFVDDCSTDNSEAICMDAAAQDPRFFVVHHLQNKRLSAVRNTGMEHARGEYILFIDSDDYIEPNTLEEINSLESSMPADWLTWGMYYDVFHSDGSVSVVPSQLNVPETVFCPEPSLQDWKNLILNTFFASTCNKLYRRSIIRRYNLTFHETCVDFEDYLFNIQYCRHVQSFCVSHQAYYHYWQPEGQIAPLKRRWADVERFRVSELLFDATKEFLQSKNVQHSPLDDIMAYAYKSYMNELEFLFRTKRFAGYVSQARKLVRQEPFAELLGYLKQPNLQKVIRPMAFMVKYRMGTLLAVFTWLLQYRSFGSHGRQL